MEEVEEANRTAIDSCHGVIGLLSQPQDQVQYRNFTVETEEAVVKFKKVVSLLSHGLGHSRVRKQNTLKLPFSQSILLDNPYGRKNYQSKNLQFPQTSFSDNSIREFGSSIEKSLCLGKKSLELSSNGKSPLHLNQGPSSTYHNILKPQQMLQPSLLLQQQHMKHQKEMAFQRKNGVINLSFESSSFTSSMSSTRPFVSPFGINGSIDNFDGSGFHLVGFEQSCDQNSQQHKGKCPTKDDGGSAKYGSSSRCHYSKKRKYSGKRSIKVFSISDKLADIPPDGYSWRMYAKKLLKGTPHPKGYYKCTNMRGCPARKHVVRCLEESSMLMVTYKGDHNHPKSVTQHTNA